MSSFDVVVPGLEIARAHLPELAKSLAEEVKASDDVLRWDTTSMYSAVVQANLLSYDREILDLNQQPITYLPSLGRIAATLLFNSRERVVINKYPPGSFQGVHFDDAFAGDGLVLQLSPNGILDYFGTEKELLVSEGDVTRINSQIEHRGRNPSDVTRYSVLFYNRASYVSVPSNEE